MGTVTIKNLTEDTLGLGDGQSIGPKGELAVEESLASRLIDQHPAKFANRMVDTRDVREAVPEDGVDYEQANDPGHRHYVRRSGTCRCGMEKTAIDAQKTAQAEDEARNAAANG